MGFKDAIEQIRFGLSELVRHKEDSMREKLQLLAKWHKRMNYVGDDWTWQDFEDFDAELDTLKAENLSASEIDRRCRALLKRDEASRSELIREIETGELVGMGDRIRALIAAGADPNAATLLKDVPLSHARYRGPDYISDLLIELGANPEKIGFDTLHQAVRKSTLEQVIAALPLDNPVLEKPDANSALWEAVKRGDVAILSAVLDEVKARGQIDEAQVGACLEYVVSGDRQDLSEMFLESGVSPDQALDSLLNTYNVALLERLVAHGADVTQIDDLNLFHEDPLRVKDAFGAPAILGFIDALLAAGWTIECLDEFEREQIRYITKACQIPAQDIHAAGFVDSAGKTTGKTNPENVTSPYHMEMARTGLSPNMARREFGLKLAAPSWTAKRFGQSTTALPDGRWLQIGGEHEDHYDPDFEIYSDVIVHDGYGGLRVFFYPADIFPPTDFHSATLVGDDIWIIGNTGYQGERQAGQTPIYRLSLGDFSIHPVKTNGTAPGWISQHKARLDGDTIEISGGWAFVGQDFVDTSGVHRLNLTTLSWSQSA